MSPVAKDKFGQWVGMGKQTILQTDLGLGLTQYKLGLVFISSLLPGRPQCVTVTADVSGGHPDRGQVLASGSPCREELERTQQGKYTNYRFSIYLLPPPLRADSLPDWCLLLFSSFPC